MNHFFPLFRKYKNNKSYFKVLGPALFEEIQVMGSYYSIHQYEAKILPDRNFIADMITLEGESWEAIDAVQYEDFINKCRKDYKSMP